MIEDSSKTNDISLHGKLRIEIIQVKIMIGFYV